jgi:hypothetical protein
MHHHFLAQGDRLLDSQAITASGPGALLVLALLHCRKRIPDPVEISPAATVAG